MFPDPPISGQTPIDDLSGLRIRTITTQSALNNAEAENIRKATLKYLAARPSTRAAKFDVTWLRALHREMFGDVWAWAGTLRTRETNLGSPPHRIEPELHDLLADLRAWKQSDMPLIEQSARLHHAAVRIHPFLNGNGRWSRLLANIWLRLEGAPPVEWPEATIGAESTIRAQYLAAIKAADRADLAPLITLHSRHQPQSR